MNYIQVLKLTLSVPSPWEEYSAFLQLKPFTQYHCFVPPGTRYCMGSQRRCRFKSCTRHLHKNARWAQHESDPRYRFQRFNHSPCASQVMTMYVFYITVVAASIKKNGIMKCWPCAFYTPAKELFLFVMSRNISLRQTGNVAEVIHFYWYDKKKFKMWFWKKWGKCLLFISINIQFCN